MIGTPEAGGAPDGPRAMAGAIAILSDWGALDFAKPAAAVSSESHLSAALLARVEEAHSYVFRRYVRVVERASRAILRDGAQVDDVVQSVFEALWRCPARFDPSRGSLGNYLRLQARNRSIDLVRSEAARAKRVVGLGGPDDRTGHLEEDFTTATSNAELRRTLALLPPSERAPIELAYFGHQTYRMVAAHLGLPEGTVKSRIRSGLLRLRALQHDQTPHHPERSQTSPPAATEQGPGTGPTSYRGRPWST